MILPKYSFCDGGARLLVQRSVRKSPIAEQTLARAAKPNAVLESNMEPMRGTHVAAVP